MGLFSEIVNKLRRLRHSCKLQPSILGFQGFPTQKVARASHVTNIVITPKNCHFPPSLRSSFEYFPQKISLKIQKECAGDH